MVKSIQFEKARKARLKEGAKLLKERIKLEKVQLKKGKFEVSQREKEKKETTKFDKKIDAFLTKKIISRKILKPSQMTMTIKKREIEPYKPIYMKDIIEQEKRSMFFD